MAVTGRPYWETVGECWEWARATDGPGYGKATADGQQFAVHRLAWCLASGQPVVPSGMDVGHLCDNRRCVRPEHLTLQSRSENIQQMYDRGRNAPGQRSPERARKAWSGGTRS